MRIKSKSEKKLSILILTKRIMENGVKNILIIIIIHYIQILRKVIQMRVTSGQTQLNLTFILDADIKEGVRGDWRLGREKTSREVERIKQRKTIQT